MKVFVREYLADANLNASEAARRAGYKGNVDVWACRLLKHPWVKAEIEKGMKEREQRTQITADEVLRELKRLAMVDVSKAYDPETGNLLPFAEMDEDVRRAISKVTPGEFGLKVEFHTKDKSLELLAKHLGLLQDKSKVELTGKDGEALQVVVNVLGPEKEEK